MRVLISAYVCFPNRGSEPGVGWNISREMAKHHDVTVLTRSAHKEEIDKELQLRPQPGLEFLFLDILPGLPGDYSNKPITQIHYVIWQVWAFVHLLITGRFRQFNLIHHVTFNTLDLPGFLWALPRPFVMGPLGGGQVSDSRLRRYWGDEWRKEQLRTIRKRLSRFNPVLRLATLRSSAILAANGDTAQLLRGLGASDVQVLLETAVAPTFPGAALAPSPEGNLRVLWAGSYIALKAPHLAVDAVHRALELGIDLRMDMIGSGDVAWVQGYVDAKGLRGSVVVSGPLPHSELLCLYSGYDAFLFTSLRDTSGNVVLEAMASGVPVVVLDQHGVADIVTNDTGIRVPIGAPEETLEGLAQALIRLHSSPELRASMGEAARERISAHYTWQKKGEVIDSVYKRLVAAEG